MYEKQWVKDGGGVGKKSHYGLFPCKRYLPFSVLNKAKSLKKSGTSRTRHKNSLVPRRSFMWGIMEVRAENERILK